MLVNCDEFFFSWPKKKQEKPVPNLKFAAVFVILDYNHHITEFLTKSLPAAAATGGGGAEL